MKVLMENNAIEVVPRKEMVDFYKSLKGKGVEVKHQQLMLIWSFKRKMHLHGSLIKHKARIFCHVG